MITRQDCLLLLSELEDTGIDVSNEISKVLTHTNIDLEVLNFINKHKPLDLLNFYNKIRTSYNHKKSKLYKEIVTVNEKEPKDILITLSSLLTQIFIFSNTTDNRQLFLKHSRIDEITSVLKNYSNNFDITPCVDLLNLVRADLKALESLERQ